MRTDSKRLRSFSGFRWEFAVSFILTVLVFESTGIASCLDAHRSVSAEDSFEALFEKVVGAKDKVHPFKKLDAEIEASPRQRPWRQWLHSLFLEHDETLIEVLLQNTYRIAHPWLIPDVGLMNRDDFVQEALLRIVRSKHRYHPQKGRLLSWAVVVAKNSFRDSLRRLRLEQGMLEGSIEGIETLGRPVHIIGIVSRSRNASAFMRNYSDLKAIAQVLGPKHRILLESLIEGRSYEEIRKLFGENVSPTTVKTRIHRFRRQIASLVEIGERFRIESYFELLRSVSKTLDPQALRFFHSVIEPLSPGEKERITQYVLERSTIPPREAMSKVEGRFWVLLGELK